MPCHAKSMPLDAMPLSLLIWYSHSFYIKMSQLFYVILILYCMNNMFFYALCICIFYISIWAFDCCIFNETTWIKTFILIFDYKTYEIWKGKLGKIEWNDVWVGIGTMECETCHCHSILWIFNIFMWNGWRPWACIRWNNCWADEWERFHWGSRKNNSKLKYQIVHFSELK